MWKPDKNAVSKKEKVGRRVFGTDPFVSEGARGPTGSFKLTAFYEDRPDANLSYDRLGVRKEDEEVAGFLLPLCINHAERIQKQFNCWASLTVGDLPQDEFIPTPPEDESNPYHCDLLIDDYRGAKATMESLAFKLSVLSEAYYPPED